MFKQGGGGVNYASLNEVVRQEVFFCLHGVSGSLATIILE